jgi:signal transduction histidine kinase
MFAGIELMRSPGIPAEAIARVVDLFFTTKPASMGLGLSIMRGIVGNEQGPVDAQSTPGRGTACVLTFPAALAARA